MAAKQAQQAGGSGVEAAMAGLALDGTFNAEWHAKFDTEAVAGNDPKRLGKASHQAEIYKGELDSGELLAIRKVYLRRTPATPEEDILGNKKREAALLKELELWRRVSGHSRVVPNYSWSVGWSKDGANLCAFMMMPRIAGETLEDLCTEWVPDTNPNGHGGLNDPADKVQLRTWDIEVCLVVEYLHEQGVAHGSLHERNIMLEPVLKRVPEKHVKLIDFGRAVDLKDPRKTRMQKHQAKDKDVKYIAFMHVFAVCGHRARANNLLDVVSKRAFTPVRAAGTTDAQWNEQKEEKKREELFVTGVLRDLVGILEPRHIMCFPYFEGAGRNIMKGSKPQWPARLPGGHSFKATGSSLNTQYKMGGATLKLREAMVEKFEHFALAPVAGHAAFDVYPSLMPLGYACMEAANEATPNPKCPPLTLYEEKQAKAHAHAPDGTLIVAASTRTMTLSAQATEEQKETLQLTRGAQAGGGVNYMFTGKVHRCTCGKHWANVRVSSDGENPRHFFVLRHEGCGSQNAHVPFYHLGQVVEPVHRYANRIEPWMEVVRYSSALIDLQQDKLAQALAKQGITWVTPTAATFKKLATDAKKPEPPKTAGK